MFNEVKHNLFMNLENFIIERKKDNPFLVGINGVDTSGKTMFTKEFENYLCNKNYKVQVVHIDDFHNPKAIRYSGNNPIDSYIDNAFNLQLLEVEILHPIRTSNLNKSLVLLDLDTDSFINKQTYKIDKDTIILLEGVLLYRVPIDKYFDMRIFLDISFDEVLRRSKIRDVPKFGVEVLEKCKTKYKPIQLKYFKQWYPKEKSDFIIDNTDYNNPRIINI